MSRKGEKVPARGRRYPRDPSRKQFHHMVEEGELNRLRQAKFEKDVEPFVKEFLDSIGVLVSTTPASNWPSFVKLAFVHAKRKFPGLAIQYLEHHNAVHKEESTIPGSLDKMVSANPLDTANTRRPPSQGSDSA